MSEQKKPGVAVWIIVALLAAVVAYPLSFGPACWVCSRVPETSALWEMTDFVYTPLLWGWYDGPRSVSRAIEWYANLGAAGNLNVAKMLDGSFCVIHFSPVVMR